MVLGAAASLAMLSPVARNGVEIAIDSRACHQLGKLESVVLGMIKQIEK